MAVASAYVQKRILERLQNGDDDKVRYAGKAGDVELWDVPSSSQADHYWRNRRNPDGTYQPCPCLSRHQCHHPALAENRRRKIFARRLCDELALEYTNARYGAAS
jgi:hypothetical protein